jgi:hypothetical protein
MTAYDSIEKIFSKAWNYFIGVLAIIMFTHVILKVELDLALLNGMLLALFVINLRLEIGFRSLEKSLSGKNPSEKDEEPTGAGAFLGMVAGGALGLPLGPLGVLVGGILGAIAGNELEREKRKKRRSG